MLGVATEGPGSLLREGNRVLADVRFKHGAVAGVDVLRGAGAKVLNVDSNYQTVAVAVRPSELQKLQGVPGVASANEVLAPVVYGTDQAGPQTAAITPCFGAATSEGDSQLRAAEAREEFGVDGSGVTVGILSDSFGQDTGAPIDVAEDVASGDLPGPGNPCGFEAPVRVLDDSDTQGEDEGRGMAQIVHDLAPGAELAFATAFTPDVFGFANNIRRLAEPVASGGAEADVIADDVFFYEEPFFQEGPVAVAVKDVSHEGVAYFSSAGNNNLIGAGKDIASWEAPLYRLASACPAALSAALPFVSQCMNFDPSPAQSDPTFGLRVAKGASLTLDLQWAEPWNGVQTDLDAYLLDKNENPIVEEGQVVSSEFANVTKTQKPFELLFWENNTGSPQEVQVAINRYTGAGGGGTESPPLKLALLENGGGVTSTEYPESSEGDVVGPTIFGHNGAEDAISVAAIPYNATNAPEAFSSRGPVTHYFKPVEGVTPAEALGSPQVLEKPDITATDGGANTFFGSCVSQTWRFFGTSAAAPHAAAVAALERQAVPAATVGQVKQAMLDTAGPVGDFPRPGPAVGAGLLNAAAAIANLKAEPFSESIAQLGPPAPLNCDLPPKPPLPGGEEQVKEVNPPAETAAPAEPPALRRPRTLFLQHPPRLVRTRHAKATVVFRFGANVSGATSFVCRVDGDQFHACSPRLVGRFGIGPHVVRVIATDAAGNADRSPAVFRFRVKQRG